MLKAFESLGATENKSSQKQDLNPNGFKKGKKNVF